MGASLNSTAVNDEYLAVTSDQSLEPMVADIFQGFGWSLKNRTEALPNPNDVRIEFKRDPYLPNRPQIVRLQRVAEKALDEIARLKRSTTAQASTTSLGLGLAGFGLLAGAVFAGAAGLIVLNIILAVFGIAAWVAGLLESGVLRRDISDEVSALIDEQYEIARWASEEAAGLLT